MFLPPTPQKAPMEVAIVIFQILLFLIPLALGAKYGPLALIGASGVSVFVIVEFMRVQPGTPPTSAVFIILAVITATAAMTAAGGMEYLVRLAGKAMAKHPGSIPVVGPLFVWLFAVLSGTGNIALALIPILYKVSYDAKVRPERVLSTSTVVSQVALMASPVAAPTFVFLTLTEASGSSLGKILAVTVPTTLIATILTSLIMSRKGKALDKDPVYLRRLEEGKVKPPEDVEDGNLPPLPKRAALSAYIFIGAVVVGTILGFFESLRPTYLKELTDGSLIVHRVPMSFMIPVVMFAAAGIIMVACKVHTKKVMDEPIIGTGLIAALLLLSVPVLAGTIVNDHFAAIENFVGGVIDISTLFFALLLFLLAALIQSQVASMTILIPIAAAAGLGVGPMLGMMGAAAGNNTLASMGGIGQASILIDETGSTKQGSFLINSSFFLPMILSVVFSIIFGLLIQMLVF